MRSEAELSYFPSKSLYVPVSVRSFLMSFSKKEMSSLRLLDGGGCLHGERLLQLYYDMTLIYCKCNRKET